MKGCQKAHSTGCSFIDFDAASQPKKQNAQLWNLTCEVMACSLQDDGF